MGAQDSGKLVRVKELAIAGAVAGVLTGLAVVPYAALGGVAVGRAHAAFEALPADLASPGLPQRSVILAADGSRLATFYYENRVEVPLARVAPIMRRAIVAIEDSRFYQHGALDMKGTMRALVANLKAGAVTQGGSTLSQQYVKNALAENADSDAERRTALAATATRKLRELRYAVGLEKRFSKDQILEKYLNIAYFGDGAYGIEAAARHYFDVHAAQLTLVQAATLAGIVRSPQAYNPAAHPVAARTRRNTVLARMAQLNEVPPRQATAVAATPLRLKVTETPNGCLSSAQPFFCDYVQHEILGNRVFGRTAQQRKALLQQGGMVIRTSLEPDMQKAAEHAVNRYVPPTNAAHKAAAEVLVRPGSGQIAAMAIDRRMGDDSKRGRSWVNLAADADHGASYGMQAGSTFKAFTLAAALEKGMEFGDTLYAPNSYTTRGFRNCKGRQVGSPVSLGNAGDGEGGRRFSLVTGTWHSVNTFFLALEHKVGLCQTARMAERFGMRRASGARLQQLPPFTLGFNEVSPVRLSAAYAAFAARGKYCSPVAITSITGPHGPMKVPGANCHQVIDQDVADAVNHVLRGVLTRGTAKGNGIGRPAAGKTGTVDDFSAAWFAGYTPDMASAVWVGDPRGGYAHPLRGVCLGGGCFGEVFGADIPAPIWQDTMRKALAGVPAHGFHGASSEYYGSGSGEQGENAPKKHKAPPAITFRSHSVHRSHSVPVRRPHHSRLVRKQVRHLRARAHHYKSHK